MKQLIPVLILYFIFDFVTTLLRVEGPFQAVHWIMLAMTVVFAGLLVLTTRQAIADYKRQKAEREEAQEKERQQQAARRRTMYIDDFADDAAADEPDGGDAPAEPEPDDPGEDDPGEDGAGGYAEYEGRASR